MKAEIKHDHIFSHKDFKGNTSGQDEGREIKVPCLHENKWHIQIKSKYMVEVLECFNYDYKKK